MNLSRLIRSRELKKFGKYCLWKYKISEDLFDKLLVNQDGKCGICRGGDPASLLIDHDHASRKVRGLLSISCNSGIGFFKDDIESLRKHCLSKKTMIAGSLVSGKRQVAIAMTAAAIPTGGHLPYGEGVARRR